MSKEYPALSLNFNAAYKEIRNKCRPYKPASIVDAILALLAEHRTKSIEDLRHMPAQQLLLLKWVCQDSMGCDRSGKTITPQEFHEIRQLVYALPERIRGRDHDTTPIRLFMRQLTRSQIDFQREFTAGTMREAALLSRQASTHPLRVMFRQRTGIDIEDFLDLGLAAFAAVALDGRVSLPVAWFGPLEAAYSSQTIQAFITLLSRDYGELRAFFRSLPNVNRKLTSEYFEFPLIRRYPFFRDGMTLHCWHPMIFYRGMEDLVHSVLSEAGETYIQDFSRLFETHVIAEAQSVPTPFLGEDEIVRLLPHQCKAPDGLLSFPECNVFVESKSGLFDESVMTVGAAEIFAHKTRALKTAILQGWAASHQLRVSGRAPAQVLAAQTDYLLVVTNKELSASNGKTLSQMYPEEQLEYPFSNATNFLPLENIFFMSIEDYERLMTAAHKSEIYIPNVLAQCVTDNAIPERASTYFEQHLSKQQVRRGYSNTISHALDEAQIRLSRAYPANAGK